MQTLLPTYPFKKRTQASESRVVHRRSHIGRRFHRLRFEQLEDRRLLTVPPVVKVNPGNLDGWTVQTSGTATVTFEPGPAVAPLGEGSVELAVGINGNSGAQVRNFEYAGTKLRDLTTLRYSAYVDNDSTNPMAGPDQAPYIILNVDLDGNVSTTSDRTLLFFEPEYQFGYTAAVPPQGPIVMGVWQSWDARIGGWWSSTGAAGAGPGADVKPLSAIIAVYPDAIIVNSTGLSGLGGVRIVAGFGAGAWDNFVGNADAFSIGVNGDTTIYDFDPGPVITSIVDSPDPSDEGELVTVTATFTDNAPNLVYTATIDWGDGTGPQPAMATFNPITGQGQVTGTHTYQDDNPTGTSSDQYTITVTVMDTAVLPNSGIGSTLHTVNNVDPVIQTFTGPLAPQPVGTPVTVTATFTDEGTADTHTATIDWGDGDTTPGVVTEVGGSGQATGTHTYTEPGVYTVTVTIMDDDLGSDSMSSDEAVPIPFFVVIFDAQGGFVTGGGWFNSPPGAAPDKTTATGKAQFGVNAKFHTGETVPRGQLHLNFMPGNIKFRSTSYSFMEVTGNTAHLRGQGTNNGTGEFFFRLDVTDDGEPGKDNDTWKIKIYQKLDPIGAIETAVLYENVLPATLGGGNIKIHMGSNGLHVIDGDAEAGGYTLTAAALDSAVAQAIAWWTGEGVDPAAVATLADTQVHIVDLPDSLVGIAGSAAIGIDANAAGIGWAINGARGGLDLVTVVTHELGHLLGFDHDDDHAVMAATIEPGHAVAGSWASQSLNAFSRYPASWTRPVLVDRVSLESPADVIAASALDVTIVASDPALSAVASAARVDVRFSTDTQVSTATQLMVGAPVTVSTPVVSALARVAASPLRLDDVPASNHGRPSDIPPAVWEKASGGRSGLRALPAEAARMSQLAVPSRREAPQEEFEGWLLSVEPSDTSPHTARAEWRRACDACFAETDWASEPAEPKSGLLAAGLDAAVGLAYLAAALNSDRRARVPGRETNVRRRLLSAYRYD